MATYLKRAKLPVTSCAQQPTADDSLFESCILCGKATDVPKDAAVQTRAYYIEGCGQLCKDCFYSLNEK